MFKIFISETFVAFVRFVVRKCFVEWCNNNEPSLQNLRKGKNFYAC